MEVQKEAALSGHSRQRAQTHPSCDERWAVSSLPCLASTIEVKIDIP